MSEIKWIKVLTDTFQDEKIRLIKSMPEGRTIVLVWLQLLTQAGKDNDDGYVRLNDNTPYTSRMLSVVFDESETIIELALNTFEQFGMIERHNGFIFLTNWERHQNIEGMNRARDLTRKRMQAYRERKKLSESSHDVTRNVTYPSYEGDATEEEIELELDLELEKDNTNTSYPKSGQDIPLYSEIISYLNEKTDQSYRPTGKKTQALIRSRWNEGFQLEDFKRVIDIKTAQWLSDEKMCKFLRPETLFGTKFESYLNEKVVKQGGGQQGSGSEHRESVTGGQVGWHRKQEV